MSHSPISIEKLAGAVEALQRELAETRAELQQQKSRNEVYELILRHYIGYGVISGIEYPRNEHLLFWAVRHPDQTTKLLKLISTRPELKEQVNIRDEYGRTPLFYAETSEAIDILVAAGAKVNITENSFDNAPKNTPLQFAICREKTEDETIAVVKALIRHNAKINAAEPNDATPLHLAAEKAYWKVFFILLSNGAQIKSKSPHNDTIAKTIIIHENNKIVEFFIEMNQHEFKPNANLAREILQLLKDENRLDKLIQEVEFKSLDDYYKLAQEILRKDETNTDDIIASDVAIIHGLKAAPQKKTELSFENKMALSYEKNTARLKKGPQS